jgi:hypothetical protein
VTVNEFNQLASRHPARLLNRSGVLLDNQLGDTTGSDGDQLPPIPEEVIAVDDGGGGAEEPDVTAPVHVPDSPHPSHHQDIIN